MEKSFKKLFNIFRIRLAYIIVVSSIITTLLFVTSLLRIYFSYESYRILKFYFIGLVGIILGSFLPIFIMGTCGTIVVGTYICDSENEKKKIKEYALLGIFVPSFFIFLMVALFFYLLFTINTFHWTIFFMISLGSLFISILSLITEKIEKEITKVYKKGFIYKDYIIPFEFICRIDYMFNPDDSKRVIIKVFVDDKKSIKIFAKPNLYDLKEVYSNIRLFNLKEKRYVEETNLNK